jgi:hypothetical protein
VALQRTRSAELSSAENLFFKESKIILNAKTKHKENSTSIITSSSKFVFLLA